MLLNKKAWARWLGGLLLLLPLGVYGVAALRRDRAPVQDRPLFEGIRYTRQLRDRPQPQVIHILTIDLSAPGLRPWVTGGIDRGSDPDSVDAGGDRAWPSEATAQLTSEFLSAQQLQVAVNANFFYPFKETTPWHYRPRVGQPANLVGLAIANGQQVSPPEADWPALCFLSQQAVIRADGDCPKGTQQAISGNGLLLENGEPADILAAALAGEPDRPYPMNVAALDASGRQLWLILSDGKQPLYSEGTRLQDMYAVLQTLGAVTAVRLDGGGSTTLAVESGAGPVLLNAVIHAKTPGLERPVANHLGFYAAPLAP